MAKRNRNTPAAPAPEADAPVVAQTPPADEQAPPEPPAAPAPEAAGDAPAADPDPDLVECAVLHNSVYGKHDYIIHLPRAVAEAAYAQGYVDTHPNAMKAIRERKA